jgi:triosephosphate isomerase
MYKDVGESKQLLQQLKDNLVTLPKNVNVIVCPPFTSLALASEMLKGSSMGLGAQNMYIEKEGAYTGEISPNMLKSAGCGYVILGHSERRQYFKETDEFINKKAKKAFEFGLIPIICIGETLEQREQGITQDVIGKQVRAVLDGLSSAQVTKLILAYEPVWAIGTGKTATPAQAQEVHAFIRNLVSKLYDVATAQALVIQYGGSVKPENARELLHQLDIDGALVGGACLKADSFTAIIKAGA